MCDVCFLCADVRQINGSQRETQSKPGLEAISVDEFIGKYFH